MSSGGGSFSIPGIGSGIDWSNYIASIRSAAEKSLTNTLGRQQYKNSVQQTTFGQIQGLVDSLKNSMLGFQDARDFKTKSILSSDSNVITGTANLTALDTATTLSVEKLATNEVFQASFTGVSSVVTTADGVFNVTVRGQLKSVAVPAGTTLQGLASLINSAGLGVHAQVFDSQSGGTNPARITITDNLTGQADPDNTTWHANLDFSTTASTLTDFSNGAFSVLTQGQDSQILISGNSIYRDSNTVDDVIPGVSLNLVSADPGVDKTITVNSSLGNASTKIKDFITKYNTVVATIRKAVKFNPNEQTQSNQTAGDPTLRSVLNMLQNAVTSTQTTLPGGSLVTALADIGITVSKDVQGDTAGLLSFDSAGEAKFNSMLSSNFDDVINFFQGVTQTSGTSTITYTGFGKNMTDIIGGLLTGSDGSQGALSSKMASLQAEGNRIDKRIQEKLNRIDKQEEFLKDKFSRLEVTLSQLNAKQSSTTAALNSIALNNQAIANH